MIDSQKKSKESTGALTMVLWVILALLVWQAVKSPFNWALPWVALGAAALLVKRVLHIRVVMAVELPIFWSIVGYSATTIFLEDSENALDFRSDASLDVAMWLAWGGVACFLAGMVLALRGRIMGKAPLEVTVTERQGVIIYLVGLLFSQVFQVIAPRSVWVIAYTFGQCVPVGLFILLRNYVDGREKWLGTWRFYLWVAAFSWWAIDSVGGGIFGATLVVMLLMFGPYLEKSRVLVVGMLIFGFAFAPLFQDVKGNLRQRVADEGRMERRQLWQVVSENCRRCFLEGDAESYRKGVVALADRLCVFDIWIRVKKHMDINRDYARGKTVWDALVTSFIPRFLWPNKPITGGSNELAICYADMVVYEGTSVGVGAISEFAINGGDTLVLLGMLGFGVVGGLTLNFARTDRVNPLGIIMGILTFSNMVRPETNLSDAVGGLVRYAVLWIVLRSWILHEHKRFMFFQHLRRTAGPPAP
jgi:hypothetical protein